MEDTIIDCESVLENALQKNDDQWRQIRRKRYKETSILSLTGNRECLQNLLWLFSLLMFGHHPIQLGVTLSRVQHSSSAAFLLGRLSQKSVQSPILIWGFSWQEASKISAWPDRKSGTHLAHHNCDPGCYLLCLPDSNWLCFSLVSSNVPRNDTCLVKFSYSPEKWNMPEWGIKVFDATNSLRCAEFYNVLSARMHLAQK